jgi:hypothetical protein
MGQSKEVEEEYKDFFGCEFGYISYPFTQIEKW